jgi:proton-dependent oligopeptide transporter, POT family
MVLNVTKLFMALPIYWAMYTQCNSRWVFQAAKMDGDLGFYTIKPDQMVMLPSVFIIILLPVFDYTVYPLLARIGLKTDLQKVTCGLICCLLSFMAATFIESRVNDELLPILWLFPQYFILAVSEVFIWVSIVNFAYTQAPERMKSVMTSFAYVTVALGSLIVMIVSGSNFIESQMHEFIMYAAVMVINIIVFVIMSSNYTFVDNK